MASENVDDLFGSDEESDSQVQTSVQQTTQAPDASETKPDMKALFGDDDDDDDDDNDNATPPDDEVPAPKAGYIESDEENARPNRAKDPAHVKLCLPSYPLPNPSATVCLLRVPQFVGINVDPFDPSLHSEIEDQTRFPFAATVMRWRFKRNSAGELMHGADGRPIRESNARLVRWSDGTTQLMVGDDVYNAELPMLKNAYSYAYASLRSDVPKTAEDQGLDPSFDIGLSKENGSHEWHNATDIAPKTCLECHTQITHSMKIMPTGLQSEQHKRLSAAVRKKTLKTKKVQEISRVTMDPEKQASMMADSRRSSMKRQRKLESRARRPALDRDFLEEGLDEGTSISAIKGRYRRGAAPRDTGEDLQDFIVNDDEEDDEEDDYEEDYSRRPRRNGNDDDDDEDDEDVEEDEDGDDDEEEEEEEEEKPRKSAQKSKRKSQSSETPQVSQKRHKRVIDDDDEDA